MGKVVKAVALDPLVIDGILKEYGDRLFYQFSRGKKARRNIRGGHFIKGHNHSYKPCIRDKLSWTVKKVPEVVIKISGSGKNIHQIRENLNYISRNGKVEMEDEQGNRTFGQETLKDIVKSWERSKVGIPKKGKRRRETFNIVLSMPPDTDEEGVKKAARKFAQERFCNHQYVFALHEDEAHPHVHLAVKAVDHLNVRMNPRKADLQEWREHFAAKLREQGIMANATPRRARGVIRKPEKQSIIHIERRKDISVAKAHRKKEIVQEIKRGGSYSQKPFQAPLLAARVQTLHAYEEIAKALSQSANSKDQKLALEIAAFIQQMPPVKTVHQQAVEAFHLKHTSCPSKKPFSNPVYANSKQYAPFEHKKADRHPLKTLLSPRVEEICEKYLGAPKSRNGRTWRYGSNQGSFAVTMSGEFQGCWYDFQTGEGGDILNLIEYAQQTNTYPELLKEAQRFLGGMATLQPRPLSKSPEEVKADREADLQDRTEKAIRIYKESKPIKGTMGEEYLRKHRGINNLPLVSNIFYFHPNLQHSFTKKYYPAIVVAIRDENQTICGTQSIFLDPKKGVKISKEESKIRTLSHGVVSIGQIVHKGKPNGQIAIAEGVETALSIAMAQPEWTVYATFSASNFVKVALHSKADSIVICADNDGTGSDTERGLKNVIKNLLEKGVKVRVAKPKIPQGQQKWDFNDVLMHLGVAAVKKSLNQAKLYQKVDLQFSHDKKNEERLASKLKNKKLGNFERTI